MAVLAMQRPDMEQQLTAAGLSTVEQARAITISSNDDYQLAGEFIRDIKTRAGDVVAYWKDPKSAAAKAHKDICAREKAMLEPLNQAEAIIKQTMMTYTRKVAEEERKAREEALRKQREEAERLLKEAAEAEAKGNIIEAETTLSMAQMVEEMPVAPVVATPAPKAAGISTRKVWKARIVNAGQVPVSFGGMVIRPVDEKLLNQLAASSKGTIAIPGVEFYQEETIAASRW